MKRSTHTTPEVNEVKTALLPSLARLCRANNPVNVSARGKIEVGANPVRGKAAFTLAEVLITLAIIGVVAALTLPTLIAKVNEKVDGNQKKVTEAKLIQGLNMLDLHGGINNT
ncbi:type II secretion system protein, partial [bacterium]|nr:type II secretion system protein [bacterium]